MSKCECGHSGQNHNDNDVCEAYPCECEQFVHLGYGKPAGTVQRWGDAQQYFAEPMPKPGAGPQVTLLSMTPDPLGEIASCAKIYRGEVCRSLADVTDAERASYFEDMQRTALDAAFEVVQFHFLLEGVTRAFGNQLVRQRMGAVYFQESLRFAVKDNLAAEVALPPSLAGTEPLEEFQLRCLRDGVNAEANATKEQIWRDKWDDLTRLTDEVYNDLVNSGMPAEEARGLLPLATTTRIHYVVNLRALKMHAGLRLCTQAQMEWKLVWAGIIKSIRKANTNSVAYVGTRNACVSYMSARLADMFQPICYQKGSCQFEASFDRRCSIRERVQAYAAAGVPSTEWAHGHIPADGPSIKPISPVEWLADPGAAR